MRLDTILLHLFAKAIRASNKVEETSSVGVLCDYPICKLCQQPQCWVTTQFVINSENHYGSQAGSSQHRVIFSWDWPLFTSFPAVTRQGLLKPTHSEEGSRNHRVDQPFSSRNYHLGQQHFSPTERTHGCTAGCSGQEWQAAGSGEIPFGVTCRPSSLAWASLEWQRMLWSPWAHSFCFV